MPKPLIKALAVLKKAAAIVNGRHRKIDAKVTDGIVRAADEVIAGKLDKEFPLVVW